MIGFTRRVAQTEIARQKQLATDIGKLQESVSTGKRLRAASDDPSAAARIAEIHQVQADHLVWSRNAGTGAAIATAADDKLEAVAIALDRAKELMITGRSDAGASGRAPLAAELRSIVADLTSYAASVDPSGRALFPTNDPIAIPVAEGLSYTATASRAAIFDTVETASGTQSLSDILTAAADALDANDTGAMTAGIAALDAAAGHVAVVRTDQGIRGERFDAVKERLAQSDTDLEESRATLEDTDLTYALTAIQAKQLSLEAAQTMFAQTRRRSLFDLLS